MSGNELDEDYFSMTLEQLLDVEVTTASKNAQKLSDAPAIISVLTAQEMQQLGATNLSQALTLLPGFTPLTRPTDETLMVVRGLSLRDGVLMLIDGITVNDAFDGSFDFYQRPIEDIARIEVIRGPGSALYGSYAVSAVIQIFTKDYQKQHHNYALTLGSGSNNRKKFSATVNHQASYLSEDLTLGGSFVWEKSDGEALTIEQDFLYTPEQGNYLPPLTNPTLTPTTRNQPLEKFNGHVDVSLDRLTLHFGHQQLITYPILSHLAAVTEPQQTIKDKTFDRLSLSWLDNGFKAQLYWTRHESKLYGQSQPPYILGDEGQDGLNEEFHSGVIENFRHQSDSRGIELEKSFTPWDKHELLLGLAYDNTELTDVEKIANVSLRGRGPISLFPAQDMTAEYMPKGIDRTMQALYLQDLWRVSASTDITLGLRYGHYNDFGTTLNPRIAVVKRLNSQAWAKMLYAQAYKPPSFAQLFDATPTQAPSRQRGNQTLQPTEIQSWELQFGYGFSPRLTSSLNIYRNSTRNEIFFNSTPGVEQWQNSGQRRSYGLEAELKGAFGGLDMAFINYSYQNVSGVDDGIGADIHPTHRVNAGLVYPLNEQTSSGLTLSYYSSPAREASDSRSRVGSKILLGLTLQRRDFLIRGCSLRLKVDNLLNQRQFDQTEQTLGLLKDIPLPGRNFTFELGYAF